MSKGKKENNLLHAAYRQLGLDIISRGRAYSVCDADGNKYACFYENDIDPDWPPTEEIVDWISNFTKIRYFEYYRFPGRLIHVQNKFFGMSREEFELRLAVAGG